MNTQARTRGVPTDPDGPLTPHTLDQLVMSSERTYGGFRLVYPSAERNGNEHATLAYCIERPQDGYRYTVITAEQEKEMSQDSFRVDLVPRSQPIDPPDLWADEAWEALQKGGVSRVQGVLRLIQRDQLHHRRKNTHVDGVNAPEVAYE